MDGSRDETRMQNHIDEWSQLPQQAWWEYQNLGMDVVSLLMSVESIDVLTVDDGLVTRVSQALVEWLVSTGQTDSSIGKPFWNVLPTDEPEVIKSWYSVLKDKGDTFGSIDVREESGAIVAPFRILAFMLEEGDMIIIEHENPVMRCPLVPGLIRVITHYQTFFENSDLGIVVMANRGERRGVILHASKEACKFLLRKKEDLIGTEFVDLVSDDDSKLFESLYSECENGRTMSFNQSVSVSTPVGCIILDAWMCPMTGAEPDMVLMVFKDETARVLLLDELRKFATAFNISNDSIFITDGDFNILYSNPMGTIVTGYEFSELLGRSLGSILVEEGEQTAIERIQLGIAERIRWVGEGWVRTKDGHQFPSELSISRASDSEGASELNVVVIRDLSRIKESERATVVRMERTELLMELLVHDLMNLIQGLVVNLDRISPHFEDPFMNETMERSMEILKRMGRLVSQAGVLSQTNVEEPFRPMIVNNIIEKTVEDVKAVHSDKEVLFEVHGVDQCVTVAADDLVHDMFFNIVDNAVRYNPMEVPHVMLEMSRRRGKEGEALIVSISDDGPGIPDKAKQQLCYRYFRRFEEDGGMGLGLYLVKSLASRYHGTVHIEDRVPGRPQDGARVVVTMPVADTSCPDGSLTSPPLNATHD